MTMKYINIATRICKKSILLHDYISLIRLLEPNENKIKFKKQILSLR